MMPCDEHLPSLHDLVDGAAAPDEAARLDAHLAECEHCRALVADLRRIRQVAAALDRPAPPARIWEGLAREIDELPAVVAARTGGATDAGSRHGSAWWLAAAAALVIGLSATFLGISRGWWGADTSVSVDGSNTVPADLVEDVEADLAAAATHYERAIAGLEAIADQAETPLDADVMMALRSDLATIDRAIEESRNAVAAEPANRVAQESLLGAFRRKVSLLQDTIALMNEVRKGNEVGAARAAEGLNEL